MTPGYPTTSRSFCSHDHPATNNFKPADFLHVRAAVHTNYVYWPVSTRHRIYLCLNSALQEGATYGISNPNYGSTNWTFSATNSFCESIKVNQVGYSKWNPNRFANFGVYMGDGGSMQFIPPPTYKVYDENTGAILTSGTAVCTGDPTTNLNSSSSSGEYVYRLSLTAVPEGGPYYVSVDGAGVRAPSGSGTITAATSHM